jgi:hypothetical protein
VGDLGDVIQLDGLPLVQAATLKETAKLIAAVDAVVAAVDHPRRAVAEGSSATRTRSSASCWGSSAASTSGGSPMNRRLLEAPFAPAQIK